MHQLGAVMRNEWRRSRDRGASAVEYALIVAAVALVLLPIVAALTGLLGDVLTANCEQTAKQNGSASPAADCQ